MKSFVAILLLISFADGVKLWARYTDVGANDVTTVDHVGSVDLKTGLITRVSDNYIYLGSSITVDGISALDSKNVIKNKKKKTHHFKLQPPTATMLTSFVLSIYDVLL
jgi:hypothetical protein